MSKKSMQKQIEDYVVANKEAHYRLVYSYVKNADDALDIIQESIAKALVSMDSLRNPQYIKTWYYRILVNTSLDFLRKQRKLVILDQESLAVYDNGTSDNYENFDLQKALDELPAKHRCTVVLRFFEDLKIEDIAEILDENVNTTKTRLYKSLEKLRIAIED